jgi:hypothetical protein
MTMIVAPCADAGLGDPAGTGSGDEARSVTVQQSGNGCDLALPADEGRQRGG